MMGMMEGVGQLNQDGGAPQPSDILQASREERGGWINLTGGVRGELEERWGGQEIFLGGQEVEVGGRMS